MLRALSSFYNVEIFLFDVVRLALRKFGADVCARCALSCLSFCPISAD